MAERADYDGIITDVAANPGAYRPQDLITLIGNNFEEFVSPQEYIATLEGIFGPGTTWDTNYPSAETQTTETVTPTGAGVVNPTDEELADMLKSYNQTTTNIKEAQRQGLISVDQAREMLTESRANLSAQRDSGLQGNRAYFGAVSPDAYQSQIGTYNTKVKDAYTQGEASLARNEENIANAAINVQNQFDTDTLKNEQGYANAIKPTTVGGYNYAESNNAAVDTGDFIAAGVNPNAQSAIGAINNNIVGWGQGAPMSTASNQSTAEYNATRPFEQWFRK